MTYLATNLAPIMVPDMNSFFWEWSLVPIIKGLVTPVTFLSLLYQWVYLIGLDVAYKMQDSQLDMTDYYFSPPETCMAPSSTINGNQ